MAAFLDLDLDVLDSVIAEYTGVEGQLLEKYSAGGLSAIRSWLCLEWLGAGSVAWSGQYSTFINAVVKPATESLTQIKGELSKHYEAAVEMKQGVSSLIATFPGLTGSTPCNRKLYYNGYYDTSLAGSCAGLIEELTKLGSAWNRANEALQGLTSCSISLNDTLTGQGLFFEQCREISQFESDYDDLKRRLCEFEASVNGGFAPFKDIPSISQGVLSLPPIDQIGLEASRDGRMYLSSDFQYIYCNGEIFKISGPGDGSSNGGPAFSAAYKTIEILEINGSTSVDIGILITRFFGISNEFSDVGNLGGNFSAAALLGAAFGAHNESTDSLKLKFDFQTNGTSNVVIIYLGSEKLNARNAQLAGTEDSSTGIRIQHGEFAPSAQNQSNSYAKNCFDEFGIDGFDENANYNTIITYSSEREAQPYPYTLSFGDNGEATAQSVMHSGDSMTVVKLPGDEPVIDVLKNLDASSYFFECPPEYSDLIRNTLNSL